MFGVLYTTSQFTSFANLECNRKSFRLSEAPSLTAAYTHSLSDTSKTATVLQNSGINWKEVTFPVKKYAICFKSVHNPLTRNASTWEAGLAHLARQPGRQDEFLLCLYEKISSRLPGQFCCFDSC